MGRSNDWRFFFFFLGRYLGDKTMFGYLSFSFFTSHFESFCIFLWEEEEKYRSGVGGVVACCSVLPFVLS